MSDGQGGVPGDDDWEHLLETGELDKKLDEIDLKDNVEGCGNSSKSSSKHNVDPFDDLPPNKTNMNLTDPTFSGPVKILTNDSRQLLRKPEPTMKILKRPEQNQVKLSESQVPKTTPKSLSQREADYAEARKRILGEEQQQQQQQVAVAAQIQAKNNNTSQQQSSKQNKQNNSGTSSNKGGSHRKQPANNGGHYATQPAVAAANNHYYPLPSSSGPYQVINTNMDSGGHYPPPHPHANQYPPRLNGGLGAPYQGQKGASRPYGPPVSGHYMGNSGGGGAGVGNYFGPPGQYPVNGAVSPPVQNGQFICNFPPPPTAPPPLQARGGAGDSVAGGRPPYFQVRR